MHNNQYAYRKGKSTEDAINAAVKTVQMAQEKYVLGLFYDISGAFDHLWWPAFFERLRQINCPQTAVQVHTKLLPGQSGWCGYISSNIAYADDLLLLVTGDSRAELEHKAQSINTQLLKWCDTRNFKRDPTIRRNEKTVRRSKSVRYLGITISERLQYNLRKKTVRRSKSVRYLGITISERLQYMEHIEQVSTTTSDPSTSRVTASSGLGTVTKSRLIVEMLVEDDKVHEIGTPPKRICQ
ncbi:Reverse transcriptase (RNA-dependent DNA polymerase) [Popillia japonica]|uniref:Reverse transcriptase (RNA-dependent DNA polymerase) n=1 Tax=Popillia japonica TaxID=7064 RepID=A0AAW1M0E0_POPJA